MCSSDLGLGPVADVQVGDPASLLASLDATSLKDWDDRLLALPGRIANARLQAAKMLEPKAVYLAAPHATLSNAQEAEAYLERLRTDIMGHIEAGNPVIL